MSIPKQLDDDVFRILLYRNQATELLLETSQDAYRLPCVPVPAHTRVAEELTERAKTSWNLETYCLFTLPSGIACTLNRRLAVLEACRPQTDPPEGAQWVRVAMLSARDFEDDVDFAILRGSLATLEQYARGELQGVFGQPGWLDEVTEWVQAGAKASRLSLTGAFRQLNASPTFSLIRFETDGPALWFKAVGEPNLHELPTTLSLTRLFPGYLPPILAVQPLWNAWLSEEISNTTLEQFTELSVWERVAGN